MNKYVTPRTDHSGMIKLAGTPLANGKLFAEAEGKVRVSLEVRGNSFRMHAVASGRGSVLVKSIGLRFERTALESRDWLELIHSYDNGTTCGVKKVGLPSRWLDAIAESGMFYVLSRSDKCKAWLFGSLPPHSGDFLKFKALHDSDHAEGRFGLEIRSQLDVVLLAGTSVATSWMCAIEGRDANSLLAEYGDVWSAARGPLKSVATGWNSWDYFWDKVTLADATSNARCMRRKLGGRAKYLVLDDGWQVCEGEWRANAKFPGGVREFCRMAEAEGCIPGVWTAPLLASVKSRIFKSHKQWLAKGPDGKAYREVTHTGEKSVLDITHPEVQEYVRELYTGLRRDGIRYFKVDFTSFLLKCSQMRDTSIPRGALLRKLFEIIRDAIGPQAYLLSCGAPFESVTGIVDASRTTNDIRNFWSHVARNAGGISARWWMHGHMWNNDPDFLLARCAQTTSRRPLNTPYKVMPFNWRNWQSGREMQLPEIRCLALLIYLTGADTFLSDDLPMLNEKGISLIRKVLDRPLCSHAMPVDLFSGHDHLPSMWIGKGNGLRIVGLFNWEENPAEIPIDTIALGIPRNASGRFFWSGKKAILCPGFTVALPPRSCEAIVVELGDP